MRNGVNEVVCGRHHVFEVLRASGLFSTGFHVRSTGGKVHKSFKHLDSALEWARKH